MKADYPQTFFMLRYATSLIGNKSFDLIIRCRQQCLNLVFLQQVNYKLFQQQKNQISNKELHYFFYTTLNNADFSDINIMNRFLNYKWLYSNITFLKQFIWKTIQGIKFIVINQQVLTIIVRALYYFKQLWINIGYGKIESQNKSNFSIFIQKSFFPAIFQRIKNKKYNTELIKIATLIIPFYHSETINPDKLRQFQYYLLENFSQFRQINGYYEFFVQSINFKHINLNISNSEGAKIIEKLLYQILEYDCTYQVQASLFKNEMQIKKDPILQNGYIFIQKDILFIGLLLYVCFHSSNNTLIDRIYLNKFFKKLEQFSELKNQIDQMISEQDIIIIWRFLFHLIRLYQQKQLEGLNEIEKQFALYQNIFKQEQIIECQSNKNKQFFKMKILIRLSYLSLQRDMKRINEQDQRLMNLIKEKTIYILNYEKKVDTGIRLGKINQIRRRQRLKKMQELKKNKSFICDKDNYQKQRINCLNNLIKNKNNIDIKYQQNNQNSQQNTKIKSNSIKIDTTDKYNCINNIKKQQCSSVHKRIQKNEQFQKINDADKHMFVHIQSMINQVQNRQFIKFLAIFRRKENQIKSLNQDMEYLSQS